METDPTETTGARIEKARETRGLSQQQLAELLEVTQPAVWKWENDRVEPSLSRLREIAAALNVDVSTLIPDCDTGSAS